MVGHQLAVCHLVIGGVVGDDGEVFHTLLYDGVDDLCGASHAQEAAEHDCHAVMHFLDGLLQCNQLIHVVYVLVFCCFGFKTANLPKNIDLHRILQSIFFA